MVVSGSFLRDAFCDVDLIPPKTRYGSILSEEILSVSLLRSSMPSQGSQGRILVGSHTNFSTLTIKPALVYEFETKVGISRAFSKITLT